MNRSEKIEYRSHQMRRMFEIMSAKVELEDSEVMEFADLQEKWQPGKEYKTGKIVSFGVNHWDETQLYRVIQPHISQSDWAPDISTSLYKAIGFTEAGIDVWTQPLGGHDSYSIGDVVFHNGTIYESLINGNWYVPGVDYVTIVPWKVK